MADIAYQPQHFGPGQAPAKRRGGILIAYGQPGVGKTRFIINTWDVASPLFFANFDRDASHLIQKYQGEGGVYYDDFVALTKEQARAALDRLTGLKNAAMSRGQGVFALDNFLAFYEMVQLALLDPDDRRGALAYGSVNSFIRNFMFDLERTGVWCIITAPAKEIWITVTSKSGNPTGQATGRFDPDGWKHADYHVVGEIWLYTNKKLGAEPQPRVGQVFNKELNAFMSEFPSTLEYYGRIETSKKLPAVEGVIIKNPSLFTVLKLMREVE